MKDGAGCRIHVNEVVMRDGLQMETHFVPTDRKVALIHRLSMLGLAKIEATAFVSPRAIPTLRDAEDVMRALAGTRTPVLSALVPNVRGATRALAAGVDELNIVMSASEAHNQSNLRMSREDSFVQLSQVIALGHQAGTRINASLSCAFGCPIEGVVPAAQVEHWVSMFAQRGVLGITLCDTTGVADPVQVQGLFESLLPRYPGVSFTAHFHDTRALALPNAIAAVEAGVRSLDASLGGIGGCPYAPGASGNVATEDLVHMLHCMNYETGVDLDGLIAASRDLTQLLGHDTASHLAKAGPRCVPRGSASCPA